MYNNGNNYAGIFTYEKQERNRFDMMWFTNCTLLQDVDGFPTGSVLDNIGVVAAHVLMGYKNGDLVLDNSVTIPEDAHSPLCCGSWFYQKITKPFFAAC